MKKEIEELQEVFNHFLVMSTNIGKVKSVDGTDMTVIYFDHLTDLREAMQALVRANER